METTTKQPTRIDPRDFTTVLDHLPPAGYAEKQHAHGVELATGGFEMHVSARGLWSASKPGTIVSTYERIGYHSCASEVLRGFLEAGGKCTFGGFRGIEGIVTL